MGTLISMTVLLAALAAGAATGRYLLAPEAGHRARPRYAARAIEYVDRAAPVVAARRAVRLLQAGRQGRHRGRTSALRVQVRRLGEWDQVTGRRAIAMTSRR
ncbi:MAG TPA: hypothetical protein VGJ44_07505 [Kribbellaceae bacterium]|jgi:hypothetical protein